ncbi:MAG: hypothetical protein MZU84_09465 [Sphingobacterium sp.]|nr:hypothetical protein [Sphingobacterium sp.]
MSLEVDVVDHVLGGPRPDGEEHLSGLPADDRHHPDPKRRELPVPVAGGARELRRPERLRGLPAGGGRERGLGRDRRPGQDLPGELGAPGRVRDADDEPGAAGALRPGERQADLVARQTLRPRRRIAAGRPPEDPVPGRDELPDVRPAFIDRLFGLVRDRRTSARRRGCPARRPRPADGRRRRAWPRRRRAARPKRCRASRAAGRPRPAGPRRASTPWSRTLSRRRRSTRPSCPGWRCWTLQPVSFGDEFGGGFDEGQ